MSIDFTNPENIIFFGIVLAFFAVIFLIALFILTKIINAIKKLFGVKAIKKREVEQIEAQLHKTETPAFTPRQKLANESIGPIQYTENEEQNIEIEKPAGTQKEVNTKDITEGLAKLKGESTQEEEKFSKIEIPRAKKFESSPREPEKTQELANQNTPQQKPDLAVKGFKQTAVISSGGVLGHASPINTIEKNTVAKQNISGDLKKENTSTAMPGDKAESFFEKPEALKEKLGIKKEESKKDESLLFGNKEEITRLEMDRKLRRDPKIWKAQKDLLLNLTPMERVKLEKEIFDPAYGRNISKTDLVRNLRRVGREMAGTSDFKKRQVLRRKIDFFKKIGGIK
jgi:hypothetical protein